MSMCSTVIDATVGGGFFDVQHYPPSSMVEVTSLNQPELLFEIDADAVIQRTGVDTSDEDN